LPRIPHSITTDMALHRAHLILIGLTCLSGAAEGRQFLASSASGQMSVEPQHQSKVDSRWSTIWTFWDYPYGANPLVQLNVDTWRKHAPGMNIVFLNDTNMKDYVPDLPDEYYRLPYPSAKSDFVRASVLYHQGGVYMDTDFLLMKPLAPLLERLKHTDIISYSDEGSGESGDCGGHYSSNFMAARKGNGFSGTWWRNVRSKLTRQCEHGEFACEKVCCNEKAGPEKETRSCHIPWAQLEHLKMPWEDADRAEGGPQLDKTNPANAEFVKRGQFMCSDLHIGKARDNSTEIPAENIPANVTTYCLKGEDSLTPHLNGEIFWQAWDHRRSATLLQRDRKMKEYDDRFDCALSGAQMNCTKGEDMFGSHPLRIPKFFDRTAYHLFFSTRNVDVSSKEDILQGDWVISEMYRRSLGVKRKD